MAMPQGWHLMGCFLLFCLMRIGCWTLIASGQSGKAPGPAQGRRGSKKTQASPSASLKKATRDYSLCPYKKCRVVESSSHSLYEHAMVHLPRYIFSEIFCFVCCYALIYKTACANHVWREHEMEPEAVDEQYFFLDRESAPPFVCYVPGSCGFEWSARSCDPSAEGHGWSRLSGATCECSEFWLEQIFSPSQGASTQTGIFDNSPKFSCSSVALEGAAGVGAFSSRRQPRCFPQLVGWGVTGTWSVFWSWPFLYGSNLCSLSRQHNLISES